MACFTIPMAVAIITTLLSHKFPEKYRMNWLNALLWGGVAMLIIEHIAHGEIVPYPPFLTSGLAEVLPEMLSVGIPMTMVPTMVWFTMVAVNLNFSEKIMRRVGLRTGAIRR